jgi:hypothetical protein
MTSALVTVAHHHPWHVMGVGNSCFLLSWLTPSVVLFSQRPGAYVFYEISDILQIRHASEKHGSKQPVWGSHCHGVTRKTLALQTAKQEGPVDGRVKRPGARQLGRRTLMAVALLFINYYKYSVQAPPVLVSSSRTKSLTSLPVSTTASGASPPALAEDKLLTCTTHPLFSLESVHYT